MRVEIRQLIQFILTSTIVLITLSGLIFMTYRFNGIELWYELYEVIRIIVFGYVILGIGVISNFRIILTKFSVLCLFMLGWPVVSTFLNYEVTYMSLVQMTLWPLLMLLYYLYVIKFGTFQVKPVILYSCLASLVLFSMPLIALHLSGFGRLGSVIFPVYLCMCILPLVLSQISKRYHLCIFVVVVIIVFATTKRTGILAISGGVFLYYFFNGYIMNSALKRFINIAKIIIMLIMFLGIAVYIDNYFGGSIVQRFYQLSEDGGSGRDVIWEMVRSGLRESSFMGKLFGRGFGAVSRIVMIDNRGIKAHNDYLEILYDYGIIGMLIYGIFILGLIKLGLKMIKIRDKQLPIYAISIFIFFMMSMFSYFMIESFIIQYISIYLGMVFGENSTIRKKGEYDECIVNSNYTSF